MNKEKLKQHKKNKAELALIEKSIEKLQGRLDGVPVIAGKVMKSSKDFPYIAEHMTVQMLEPKTAEELKKRIHEKEIRKAFLETGVQEVEEYIANMPEGIVKHIFELIYLDGFTQKEAAEAVGYSKGRISQIISQYQKD